MPRIGIKSGLRRAAVVEIELNALQFPSNGAVSPRMRLLDANLLPFSPATYIWEITPTEQTGYQTTFFYGEIDGGFGSFNAAYRYVGFNLYIDNKWEISADGDDFTTDDNAHDTTVEWGRKYLQAGTVEVVGANYIIKFYWDLPDIAKVISASVPTGNYSTPPIPGITIGGNDWAPNTENLSGKYQRNKMFDAILTPSDIQDEAADLSQLVTAAGIANIWFGKRNWGSNTDLTCDYGTGHALAWADSGNKATLVSA